MRADNPALIQQGQFAVDFQDALDDKHYIRPTCVVLVEAQAAGVLQCPRQNSFSEFSNLFAVIQDDGILPDEVYTADVTVQIDADARPVQSGCDLFNVR